MQLATVSTLLAPALSLARTMDSRALSFYHTHTGKELDVTYRVASWYDPKALKKINYHLRDFRTKEVHPIDPHLLDILYRVNELAGGGVFEVISGYRSPETNTLLRGKSGGVAKRSLHMKGQAIDVRLAGVKTGELRDIARSLQRGGVGYYPKSGFVHIDTGRVRFW